MNEKFLQFIWQHSLYEEKELYTTDGEKITVLNCGEYNINAGPDFLNAKIKIGDTIWAGSIEVHVRSSDWYRHKHNTDPAYNNVILQVVYENDQVIYRNNKEQLPVTILKFPLELYEKYLQLITNHKIISCKDFIKSISTTHLNFYFNRLIIERLEDKTSYIEEIYNYTNKDWEETFYIALAKNFGFKTNSDSFEQIAKSLPIKYINKHSNDLFAIESLLFGQAGLLNKNIDDEYFIKLKNEYTYLSKKFSLKNNKNLQWKFLRTRPVNFPTIRIAQLAALLYNQQNLFSRILETKNFNDIKEILKKEPTKYWEEHFIFGKKLDKKRSIKIGKESLNNIMINTIVPMLFYYGLKMNIQEYRDRAIELLEQTEAESNIIIREMIANGFKKPRNALESQALIQLRNKYCKMKKCLNCWIGKKYISTNF